MGKDSRFGIALYGVTIFGQPLVAISALDNLTIGTTENIVINAQVSSIDSSTLLVTESRVHQANLFVTDILSVSLIESITLATSSGRSDTLSLSALTETSLIAAQTSGTDPPVIGLSDIASLMAVISPSDSGSLTITEGSSTLRASINPSDSFILSLTESALVSVTTAALDSTILSLSEGAGVSGNLPLTDSPIISLIESTSINASRSVSDTSTLSLVELAQLAISVSDNVILSVVEAVNIMTYIASSDSVIVGITESTINEIVSSDNGQLSAIENVTTTANNSKLDSGTLSLNEAAVINSNFTVVDEAVLGISDVATINVSTNANDTGQVGLDIESGILNAWSPVNDNINVGLTEIVSGPIAEVTTMDNIDISVVEQALVEASSLLADIVDISVSDFGQVVAEISAEDSVIGNIAEEKSLGATMTTTESISIRVTDNIINNQGDISDLDYLFVHLNELIRLVGNIIDLDVDLNVAVDEKSTYLANIESQEGLNTVLNEVLLLTTTDLPCVDNLSMVIEECAVVGVLAQVQDEFRITIAEISQVELIVEELTNISASEAAGLSVSNRATETLVIILDEPAVTGISSHDEIKVFISEGITTYSSNEISDIVEIGLSELSQVVFTSADGLVTLLVDATSLIGIIEAKDTYSMLIQDTVSNMVAYIYAADALAVEIDEKTNTYSERTSCDGLNIIEKFDEAILIGKLFSEDTLESLVVDEEYVLELLIYDNITLYFTELLVVIFAEKVDFDALIVLLLDEAHAYEPRFLAVLSCSERLAKLAPIERGIGLSISERLVKLEQAERKIGLFISERLEKPIQVERGIKLSVSERSVKPTQIERETGLSISERLAKPIQVEHGTGLSVTERTVKLGVRKHGG